MKDSGTKHMFKILVTRELSDSQIDYARSLGLEPVIEPALTISFRENWLSVETALKETPNPRFAFTSQNGVEALSRLLDIGITLPENPVMYSVGNKTAAALQKVGYKSSVPEVENGTGLAKVIVEDLKDHPDREKVTILHFCGNKRRDELRQFLENAEFTVKDIVVYETELNRMSLPKDSTDAWLFFSPTGVQAFRNSGGFQNGELPHLFAIGTTTAEELSIESGKHVFISPEASVETMLKFTASILHQEEEHS